MDYATTMSFSVLLSGIPCKMFTPERGLRQGDPLSPYLFILCAEVLSKLILKAQEEQAIHGIRITTFAFEISHLFFANDNILFFRANMKDAEKIKQVLIQYQQASGQLINLNKSEISFSQNTTIDRQNLIQ